MRRALPAVAAILAVALLVGCGSSGGRSATVGDATVTVPADVDSVKGELTAILDQFPYQRWFTSCVERHLGEELSPSEEEKLASASDADREARVNQIIGEATPNCEVSKRALVDPNATSEELDLLRAELVPTVNATAEANALDPSQTECITEAFEKLPDRFIVDFANGHGEKRRSILLTVFQACAEAD